MKTVLACILSLGLLLAGCEQPVAFKSTDISGVDWGKDFSLTDHQGQARRLADYKGKAVVLFFGYTQCPDVCPTTLISMREVLTQLGPDASRVQVLFVTLDPERDTQELLAQYAPSSACVAMRQARRHWPRISRCFTPASPEKRQALTPSTTQREATLSTRRDACASCCVMATTQRMSPPT